MKLFLERTFFEVPPICLGFNMSIYCSQIDTSFKILKGLVHIISSELTNNDSLCLFHVIELHKIWEKSKWDGNFRQNHYEWAYFFEKLVDFNLLFIAVGRPNPDQCFGKALWNQSKFRQLKQGCYVIFWRGTLIVKQPLTAHNWQKWKSIFLTCHCHKIYGVEAVGLKKSNYTFKNTMFVIMWNLGQFREKLIFCQ